MTDKQVEKLNELLRGENMAKGIYGKTKNLQGDEEVQKKLDSFEKDHARHSQLLSQRIEELGGNPQPGSGFAGMMANMTSSINALRGPKHLLEQIYDGEDKGIHAYEDRMEELDPVTQQLVQQIMTEDHEHLKYFKERMEEESQDELEK